MIVKDPFVIEYSTLRGGFSYQDVPEILKNF